MSKTLDKVVTIYNRTGETDYRAEYEATVIRDVYTTDQAGVIVNGDSPNDSFIAYIFDKASKAESHAGESKQYISPEEWDALADKSGYWTVHDDGNDVIVPGITAPDAESPIDLAGARKVVRCHRHKAGTPRMWHRKVVAT